MTTSLEDHAAMRLSGRLIQPFDCTCEEYATLIVDQAAEIKRLKRLVDGCICKELADRIVELKADIENLEEYVFNMG